MAKLYLNTFKVFPEIKIWFFKKKKKNVPLMFWKLIGEYIRTIKVAIGDISNISIFSMTHPVLVLCSSNVMLSRM